MLRHLHELRLEPGDEYGCERHHPADHHAAHFGQRLRQAGDSLADYLADASRKNLTAAPNDDEGELGAVLTLRVGAVPAGGAGDVCFQAQIK